MGTLLTTSRMHPALAARIEASVRGRRGAARGPVRLRLVSVLRVGALAAILVGTAWFVRLRQRDGEALERSRAALLAAVRAHAASLSPDDASTVTRAEAWLVRFAGSYEGDRIAKELEEPGALAAILSRPLVYVRGPIDGFRTAAGIAAAAATSLKDPFVLCLLEVPESRVEKVLLGKVHEAYAGGARLEARTPNVRRLHEAEVGLPLLAPAWAARVQAATEAKELERLERQLETTPLEAAKKASRARLLLVALDEPGDAGGLSELDGERPHDVRIGLVDLGSEKTLLRLRKRVDPGWISLGKRANYASGLDGCALALDVHASVGGGG